jgi:NAD(P)-dependent dehydrogenase (short-subunit alcohol dehydrogenase family)
VPDPGYFCTDLTEVFYRDPTWCGKMLEKIPAGRFGVLDDLVGATVFLCSDAARCLIGVASQLALGDMTRQHRKAWPLVS